MMLANLVGLLDAPLDIQRNTPAIPGPYEAAVAAAPAEWLAWVGCELLGRAVVHRMTFARACVELAGRTVPIIAPVQCQPRVRDALDIARSTAMSRAGAQRAACAVFEASHDSYFAHRHRSEGSEQAFEACAEACWVAGAELETSAGVAFELCLRRCGVLLGSGLVGKVLREHITADMAAGLRLLAAGGV